MNRPRKIIKNTMKQDKTRTTIEKVVTGTIKQGMHGKKRDKKQEE